MGDDARDAELARIMRGVRLAPPAPPIARPVARRANIFEAAPIHAPVLAPLVPRRQGVKRKLDRMQRGNGKKICPKCHGYL